jgi:hypothetical protein
MYPQYIKQKQCVMLFFNDLGNLFGSIPVISTNFFL